MNPTHFDRFNAFVRGGWLARLKPPEVAVWLVYLQHADADGRAFPSLPTIAALIGHRNTGHVCTARRSLITLRLLEVVKRGTGPGDGGVYRVMVPTSPQQELVPRGNRSPAGTPTTPPQEPQLVPERDSEHPKEHPKEQKRPPLHKSQIAKFGPRGSRTRREEVDAAIEAWAPTEDR